VPSGPNDERVHVVDHPLVAHRLTELRSADTGPERFRALAGELAAMLAYEASRALTTRPTEVITPLGAAPGARLAPPDPLVVPVLRAGLSLLDATLTAVPTAEVALIGLRRDEHTLVPSLYCDTVPPELGGRDVFVLDPMLATGGTLETVIGMLTAAICLLSAPEGVSRLESAFPGDDPVRIRVVTAAMDERLNDRGYIIPGLGDAGDRLFGRI